MEKVERQLIAVIQVEGLPGGVRELPMHAGGSLRIGRLEENDLVLQDTNVSRFHAVIQAGESNLFLTDLTSLNGSFVNDRRIGMPVMLQDGDEIRIATFVFRVRLCSAALGNGATVESTISTGMKVVNATVVVLDVNRFTRLSEALPEKDVAEMLSAWLGLVGSTVQRWGGVVEKTIGDSLLATWRGKHAVADRESSIELARNAIECVRDVQVSTARIVRDGVWKHESIYPWWFKTSLSSGEATCGVVSTGEIREFTVLGDTVNIAFRLNDLCPVLGVDVLLAENTAELLENEFPVRLVREVAVEGRESLVRCYAIGWPSALPVA